MAANVPTPRAVGWKGEAEPPSEQTRARDASHRDDEQIVQDWTNRFNQLLESGDFPGVAALFATNGYLRDLVALTWHLHTYKGLREIEQAFRENDGLTRPRNFRLTESNVTKRKRKADGTAVIETILDFETVNGTAKAVLRLIDEPDGAQRAWVLSTALRGLDQHPERVGEHRFVGTPSLDTFGGKNWLDRRRDEEVFDSRDPEVLVVGAAQSGLGVAARLRALDVDALVIDRFPRVGDVWRNRYHSLTLHNAVWLNHLPYLPFPDTWPIYIPKDKLANWFEGYAEAMELNVWTSTELVGATYDSTKQRWIATLRTSNDDVRTVQPAHIVMATGASGTPIWPQVPGMDAFGGTVIHSADFAGGSTMTGTRAVVFGSGNSAHDVAQDLYVNGDCQVTMVQRNSTTIVDINTVHKVYDRYSKRLSPELADLLLVATPYELSVEAFRSMTEAAKECDRELISKLESVGFRTDYGEDETGHRMKYLRNGGGYYINVGCSNLIVEGAIDLLQYNEVAEIVEEGLLLVDGRIVEADLIVMATGYENQSALVRRIFGAEVAERVGPIWGYDEEGELRGMYKRTEQPGLWFHAGSLTQSRVYSRLVALQIKACLEGLLDADIGTTLKQDNLDQGLVMS
jgi:cation diffusion facilitator CzcD-associated flavoprotein CzcO